MLAKSSTNENMVTFKSFTGDLHLCPKQTNVPDIMLRTGIGATSEMNIDWLIQFELFLQVSRKLQCVAFSVTGSEFAIGVSGASNQVPTKIRYLPMKSDFQES